MEIVEANEWINATTLWRVEYEFADPDGGGETVDYFKTMNGYTPPSGPEIRRCLDGDELTVIRIEKIQCYTADTPEVQPSLMATPPDDARHRRIYDLIGDGPEHSFDVEIEGFET